MNKEIQSLNVIPQTYKKHGFIVITYGWKIFINGKKFPKARGGYYSTSYYQHKGGEDAVVKKAIKEFRKENKQKTTSSSR
mgnify:CR=1 FL=1